MALPHRTALALGALVAALAGGLIAWALIGGRHGEPRPPPPASVGGLVIDSSGKQVGRIDAAKPLRCFVGGRFVGELSIAQCAARNGVATEALDLGVDQNGAITAAPQGAAPPPAVVVTHPHTAPGPPATAATSTPAAPTGACWRFADGQWRKLPSDTSLNGCVQALFAGRCEHPGEANYGRWMQQTLRLVPGRVEISSDNHSFKTLVEQGSGCSIPAAG